MKTFPLLNKSSRRRRVATRATETLITLSVTSVDELFDFQHVQFVFVLFPKGQDADVAQCLLLPSPS